jgi:hypothetical protein
VLGVLPLDLLRLGIRQTSLMPVMAQPLHGSIVPDVVSRSAGS